MRRALVIREDGSHALLKVPTEPTSELQALREAVRGDIEFVRMPGDMSMFCNENGKINGLELNPRATKLSGLFPHDVIVGPVVIMGEVDDQGETLGLTDEQLDRLFNL